MIKQLFGSTQSDSLFGFLRGDVKVSDKLEELLGFCPVFTMIGIPDNKVIQSAYRRM